MFKRLLIVGGAALLVAGCVAAAFAFLLLVVVPLVTLVTHRQASAPEVIAQEIVDDLEAALEQFRPITSDLQTGTPA